MDVEAKLFYNGNIFTNFDPKEKVESIVISDGKILFYGDRDKSIELAKAMKTLEVDLEGKTLMPGLIDSHIHLDELGIKLNSLDLSEVTSIEELKNILRDYDEKKDSEWILGYGWDQEKFKEQRWPTRWDLDEIINQKPVLLSRTCLHAGVLNSKAMKVVGLMNEDSDHIKKEDGEKNGVVTESMYNLAKKRFKTNLSDEILKEFFKDGLNHLASQGITTAGFMSCDQRSLKVLQSLNKKDFRTRIRVYLNPGEQDPESDSFYSNMELLDTLDNSYQDLPDNEILKILGVKMLADGSLGSRTAYLSENYNDKDTNGQLSITKDYMEEVSIKADDAGFQISIHGIGDETIDEILDIYDGLENLNNLNHRLEHAQVIREDQIEKLSQLNVPVSVQPYFIISDDWSVDRVGEERSEMLYPFKSFLKKDITLALGTDAPVEKVNPWRNIYAAVTRGENENIPLYDHTEDQKLSLGESLNCYTKNSAKILNSDNLGSLEEGKEADFILLKENPFEINKRDLKEIEVDSTFVGGEKVSDD